MNLPDRCAELRELVWLAIDGELSDDERRTLDRHLAECAACRAKVESARRVAAGLQSLPNPPAPAGFQQATLARIDAGRGIRAPWRWQALAAAAAVVALATWWGMRRGGVGPAPADERSLDQVASAPKDGYARDGDLGRLESAPATRAPPGTPPPPEAAPLAEGDALKKNVPMPESSAGTEGAEKAEPPAGDGEREAARESSSREWKEEEGKEVAKAERKDDADDAKKSKVADGLDGLDGAEEKRRDQGEPAARGAKNPIELAVRAAETPAAALLLLLDRLDVEKARSEQGLVQNKLQDKKADEPAPPAGELRAEADRESADEQRLRDASTKAAAAKVDFLDVSAGNGTVRAWLKARGAIAEEGGVAVVDVTPEQRAELLAALERAKRPAQPKDATAWVERVAAAAPARKLATGAKRTVSGLESGDARKGEAKPAPPRVRVVLWLGPPR